MPTLSNTIVEPQKAPSQDRSQKPFVYVRDHMRSLRQIANDNVHRDKESKEPDESQRVDPSEQPSVVEKEKTPEVRQEEPKIDAEKVAREAADRAAAETSKAFRDEINKIAESQRSATEKKKLEDELTSVWDREGRLPQDYKEIFNEAQRVAQLKARQEFDERMDAREQAEATRRAEAERQQVSEQQKQAERENQVVSKISQEIDELRASKFLPPIAKEADPTDVGNKAMNELLEFGIKLNKDRVARGESAIDSVAKIYFMHYKPYKDAHPEVKQPAGADAPITGATNTPSREPSTKAYVYARDHRKSYRQILMDRLHRS